MDNGKPNDQSVLSDLNRAKALFQMKAIMGAMGIKGEVVESTKPSPAESSNASQGE